MNRCIYPGTILLPKQPADLTAWACLACDQHTSNPAYWEQVRLLVGDKPSTLHLILPECYLSEASVRVPMIHQTMEQYVQNGVLEAAVSNGYVLTERSTGSGARVGLVALLDLETYDYHKGSQSPVRATEETIEARIPPRLAVRRGAALETSHVMMLMDDPMMSVVEPLYEKRDALRQLYDFPLMMDGGHLTGYAIESAEDIAAVDEALNRLAAQMDGEHPLLFAVGDGNHSLATAKAYWEEVKRTLTPEETTSHPARFAMVELENIHDDALQFEPIHRVLFGFDGDDLLDELSAIAQRHGASIAAGEGEQEIVIVYEGKEVTVGIKDSPYRLTVATLQAFLDEWLKAHPTVRLDYIHGEAAVRELAQQPRTIGFLLPKPDKSDFFATVEREGSLPRKTFSLGEANEKRYYTESRGLSPLSDCASRRG